MERDQLTNRLVAWSALATGVAGAIHLWIIPEHWEHAPAHALFFLLVGIIQIVWSYFVWRQPSTKLYYIGVGLAGWLIVLYGITRLLPAPFGHGPETVDMIGLACKLCEGLGMVTLAILIFQGMILKAGRTAAWRVVASIVLFSIISAFITYGIARAAEPLFPSLSTPAEENHHEEATPGPDHDH